MKSGVGKKSSNCAASGVAEVADSTSSVSPFIILFFLPLEARSERILSVNREGGI
jgi:hypothetical protein